MAAYNVSENDLNRVFSRDFGVERIGGLLVYNCNNPSGIEL